MATHAEGNLRRCNTKQYLYVTGFTSRRVVLITLEWMPSESTQRCRKKRAMHTMTHVWTEQVVGSVQRNNAAALTGLWWSCNGHECEPHIHKNKSDDKPTRRCACHTHRHIHGRTTGTTHLRFRLTESTHI
jgi:hypothetical protein